MDGEGQGRRQLSGAGREARHGRSSTLKQHLTEAKKTEAGSESLILHRPWGTCLCSSGCWAQGLAVKCCAGSALSSGLSLRSCLVCACPCRNCLGNTVWDKGGRAAGASIKRDDLRQYLCLPGMADPCEHMAGSLYMCSNGAEYRQDGHVTW